MTDNIKHAIDAASVGTVVATLIGWLPAIAAMFSIVWTIIQIYDWYKRKKRGF
jgi:hypothetical protein